ncbi:MAG TPA: hypothetical protein VME21_17185 [Steroidobacteraceae bacterium]|nr:hypothetical protein [Steroidobacteraceae bacterium]
MRALPCATLLAAAALLAIAVQSLSVRSVGAAAGARDLPPDVAADHWVPISASLGIVLLSEEAPDRPLPGDVKHPFQPLPVDKTALLAPLSAERRALLLMPRATGYLMVKHHGVWRRFKPVDPLSVGSAFQ